MKTAEIEKAECFLQRSIASASAGESHLRKAWALLTNCQRQQKRIEDAINSATQALSQFQGDKELLFRRATLLQEAGRLEEAIVDYIRVLHEKEEKSSRVSIRISRIQSEA